MILAHVYFHLCDHISHFTLILFAIIHNASRKSFFHCEGGEGGITDSTKIRVDFTEKPFLILYNHFTIHVQNESIPSNRVIPLQMVYNCATLAQ